MSKTYLKDALPGVAQTPQDQAIPGREADMVVNNAGGYVFAVDDFERLRRFLILGTEGGTYYQNQQELTAQNAGVVLRCLKNDGIRTVNTIVEVSDEGRAPKNDQAIFALALAANADDEAVRRRAFDAIPEVCRIGTHLFMFCDFVDTIRGWGRGLKRGVGAWYEDKSADDLAYQLVKYRQRGGWTHRDVLRLSHPEDHEKAALYDWTCARPTDTILPEAIQAFEAAQQAQTPQDIVKIIERYGNKLPHEAIPTNLKADGRVWDALIHAGLPLTAMIRNLANMTRYGTLTVGSEATKIVRAALADSEKLQKARIHPVNVLRALYAYKAGRPPVQGSRANSYYNYGFGQPARTDNTWTPVGQIIDSLDGAFYLAFGNVPAYGKTRLLAIDVSGSMSWENIGGIEGFTARDAAAAMSLVSVNTGDPVIVTAFSTGLTSVNITARQRLDDAIRTLDSIPMGGTDIAQPMIWAKNQGVAVDIFEIYTDNETWAGRGGHPKQALDAYRNAYNPQARCVVTGMTSTGFSVADPADPGMLDVVGFDTAAPQLISDFGAGLL